MTPDSGNPNNGTPYTPNSNDPQPDASPSTPPDRSPSVPPSVSPSVSPEPSVPTAETPDQTHSPAPSVSAEPSTSPDSEPTVPQQPTVPTGSTETPSVASTDTVTPNATATDTPHPTLTATYDATATVTVTVSATGTDTPYPTLTAESTPTVRPTRTGRPRRTKTPRPTKTPNKRRTPQATKTPTTQATATTTFTPFPTATGTTPPTVTATVTVTITATETSTFTPTDTDTPTPTATDTPEVCVDVDKVLDDLINKRGWNDPITCEESSIAEGADGASSQNTKIIRTQISSGAEGVFEESSDIVPNDQISCAAEPPEGAQGDMPTEGNEEKPDRLNDPFPPPAPRPAGKQCCFYHYSDKDTGTGWAWGDDHLYNAEKFNFGWRTGIGKDGVRRELLTPGGKRQPYCDVVYHCPTVLLTQNVPLLDKDGRPLLDSNGRPKIQQKSVYTQRECRGFEKWNPDGEEGKGEYNRYATAPIKGDPGQPMVGRTPMQNVVLKENCTSMKQIIMTHAEPGIGNLMCKALQRDCTRRENGNPIRGESRGMGCSQAGDVKNLCVDFNNLAANMKKSCKFFEATPEKYVMRANRYVNTVPAHEEKGLCTWETPDGSAKYSGANFLGMVEFVASAHGFIVCERRQGVGTEWVEAKANCGSMEHYAPQEGRPPWLTCARGGTNPPNGQTK